MSGIDVKAPLIVDIHTRASISSQLKTVTHFNPKYLWANKKIPKAYKTFHRKYGDKARPIIWIKEIADREFPNCKDQFKVTYNARVFPFEQLAGNHSHERRWLSSVRKTWL